MLYSSTWAWSEAREGRAAKEVLQPAARRKAMERAVRRWVAREVATKVVMAAATQAARVEVNQAVT